MVTALVPELEEGTGITLHHRWLPADAHGIPVPNNETSTLDVTEKFKFQSHGRELVTAHDSGEYIYYPVSVVSETIALFARALPDRPDVFSFTPIIEDCNWCLDHDLIDPEDFFSKLKQIFAFGSYDFAETLRAIGFAASFYDDLTNATVHAGVLARPLKDTHWAMGARSSNLRQGDVVSMMSYLETGIHDIDPNVLKNVIAFSYADSIFVSKAVSYFLWLQRDAKISVNPRSIRDSIATTDFSFPENSWKHRQTRTQLSPTSTATYNARD